MQAIFFHPSHIEVPFVSEHKDVAWIQEGRPPGGGINDEDETPTDSDESSLQVVAASSSPPQRRRQPLLPGRPDIVVCGEPIFLSPASASRSCLICATMSRALAAIASGLEDEWGEFAYLGFKNLREVLSKAGDTIFVVVERDEEGATALGIVQTTPGRRPWGRGVASGDVRRLRSTDQPRVLEGITNSPAATPSCCYKSRRWQSRSAPLVSVHCCATRPSTCSTPTFPTH